MTNTLAVGEIADLLYSLAFIMPATLFYQKHRTFKGAIKALIFGLFCQLVVSLVANVYVMFPFYMKMFGLSEAALLNLVSSTKDPSDST